MKLSQKLRAKKGHQLYSRFFSLTNLAFFAFSHIFSNKTTVIEYIDVTVLLESIDLTAVLEYLDLTTQNIREGFQC